MKNEADLQGVDLVPASRRLAQLVADVPEELWTVPRRVPPTPSAIWSTTWAAWPLPSRLRHIRPPVGETRRHPRATPPDWETTGGREFPQISGAWPRRGGTRQPGEG